MSVSGICFITWKWVLFRVKLCYCVTFFGKMFALFAAPGHMFCNVYSLFTSLAICLNINVVFCFTALWVMEIMSILNLIIELQMWISNLKSYLNVNFKSGFSNVNFNFGFQIRNRFFNVDYKYWNEFCIF